VSARLHNVAARCWYALARFVVGAPLRTLFRLRAEGLENVPREGPVIFASNHMSYIDPPAIGVACPRMIHFMAKKSLFAFMPVRALVASLGAFPVDRSKADRKALAKALDLLASGSALGIFPEGSRGKDALGQGQEGTAWLSIKAGCPVTPVAVVRTRRVALHGVPLAPRGFVIRFGKPIEPAGSSRGTHVKDKPLMATPAGETPITSGRRYREIVTVEIMRGIHDLLVDESTEEGEADG